MRDKENYTIHSSNQDIFNNNKYGTCLGMSPYPLNHLIMCSCYFLELKLITCLLVTFITAAKYNFPSHNYEIHVSRVDTWLLIL